MFADTARSATGETAALTLTCRFRFIQVTSVGIVFNVAPQKKKYGDDKPGESVEAIVLSKWFDLRTKGICMYV
jgi:hypothetical protein